MFHLNKNSLNSKTQSGFRTKRCTIDQVINLEDQVKRAFKKGDKSMTVFFDLIKPMISAGEKRP